MRILALSGSLRARSINSVLLRAVSRLAPSHVSITLFGRLNDLPLFNPDDDVPPATVERFRVQVAGADALMIASPEYAHGLLGANLDEEDMLNTPSVATSLRASLSALGDVVILQRGHLCADMSI